MEVYALNVLKTTQRDYGIDLLRIISMLMVPIVHVIGQGGILGTAVPFSIQYESAWMLMSFVLVAVNCFILLNNYPALILFYVPCRLWFGKYLEESHSYILYTGSI